MLLQLTACVTGVPLVAFNWISDEDKLFLTGQVKWMIDGSAVTLTRQLVPKHKKLYGPAHNFSDLTVGEFFYADRLYNRFMQKRKEEDLNRFIAVLYRKKKGLIREPFNNETIEFRQKKIERWKSRVKNSILVWYNGCRNELVKNNPDLFSNSGEEHPLGFYAVISNISPKFGTVENTMNVRLKTFALEWKKAVHDNKPKQK